MIHLSKLAARSVDRLTIPNLFAWKEKGNLRVLLPRPLPSIFLAMSPPGLLPVTGKPFLFKLSRYFISLELFESLVVDFCG